MPASFDEVDLQDTARRIRQKLDGDEELLALLEQILDQARAHQEMWSDQLSDLEAGQKSLFKAMTMLAKHSAQQDKRLQTITKGLTATYSLVKSQRPLTKSQSQPLVKSQGTVTPIVKTEGLSLAAAERLGTLAKTISATFGSSGGHQLAYNAALASKMILEGTLSPKQHQTWKRSNRLHDAAWESLQRRKVG